MPLKGAKTLAWAFQCWSESWSLRHKKPCSAPNTPENTPVSYLHNMNIKGLLFNIVRGERYLTSSSTFRREIPTMSAQLCQDLFNGFLLQRDNPAGKAWFSPLIFPQRGILRYRTNHTKDCAYISSCCMARKMPIRELMIVRLPKERKKIMEAWGKYCHSLVKWQHKSWSLLQTGKSICAKCAYDVFFSHSEANLNSG